MSAMSMLGMLDGDIAGYLDIASVIEQTCKNAEKNLWELWSRLVFNVCVSNTDDHLRNHGFILENEEWTLSPAFDVNPNFEKGHMSLLIGDTDNADINEVVGVSEFFRIDNGRAIERVTEIQKVICKNWRSEAKKLGISKSEQERMKGSFSQAYVEIH